MKASERAKRLSAKFKKVSVQVRGESLYLRATLPPRPGSLKQNRHQQEISLGIPVSEEGWSRIEAEASKLNYQLIMGTFDWKDWIRDVSGESGTVGAIAAAFKAHHLATSNCSEQTWEKHWQKAIDRMPQAAKLTANLIWLAAASTEANTHTRKRTCQYLQRLADFAGIEVDLKPLQGGYSIKAAKERIIPSDEEIERAYLAIPNPKWQRFYALMACFGLRTHEVMFIDWIDELTIRVLKGKTGPRDEVKAIPPQWAKEWNLHGELPKIKTEPLKAISWRADTQFERYGIPFPPYSLRHAYAIRAAVKYRIPTAVVSDWMGHDKDTNMMIYQRWLNADHRGEVYRDVFKLD